ncbi:MAG: restriction endonuclease subunit S, partial [Flavobacteriia bacterium]|nr:restriction endonuclease subunit S [Flavobacteriia bacterium]
DLGDLPLVGLSIQKKFIPSIANTIGTDMSTYRIIERNQFAYGPVTSRNGDKITIALFNDYEKALISQAYIPFEVKDSNELDPEYLMMWFRRPEFDRYARFKSHGSAREIFDWEEMCNTLLPIPHITKQREIVKEYNTIKNRIALNQQLIQKLEETAQAIYKQWFVEFEFPDENGKPYKSSGGEMVFNEELQKEIPKGWICSKIGDVAQVVDCLHSKKPNQILKDTGGILLQIENIADLGLLNMSRKYFISKNDYKLWTSRIELSEGDCILTNVGVDAIAQIPKGFNAALGRNMTGVRCKKDFEYPSFLITTLLSNSMKIEIENKKDTGTIMQALNVSSIPHLRFVKGVSIVLMKFENLAKSIRLEMELLYRQNQKLTELKDLLLSKLATVE